MKTAVVFYSKDGSTRLAAHVVAQKTGADIFELKEVRERKSSPISFMAQGFAALVGKRSRLKDDFTEQMKSYERVIIGTPIWAGKPVPAVNAFVHRLDASEKRCVVFSVQADKNADAPPTGALVIKAALEKKGAIIEQVIRLCGEVPGKTAKKEDVERQIDIISLH